MTESLRWSWPAEVETVPLARRHVMGALRDVATADPPLSDIGLAVSEAVTNAVLHAYVRAPAGEVRVGVEFADADILLTVEDDGHGLVPRPDTPGIGLGLPLIATVADRVEMGPGPSGGTRISAWFVREMS